MPIQIVPQKGRTEAFGDLFSGALSGILAGKQLKRKWTQEEQDRAAQDALRIWQMAQYDPLVLQTPQAQRNFELAGWPVPAMKSRSLEELMASVPKGYEAKYGVDPLTGRVGNFTVQPKDLMMDAYRRARIDEIMQMLGYGGEGQTIPETGSLAADLGASTSAKPVTGMVPPLMPFDVTELAKKLDPISKQQLMAIIKEGDPAKMQTAYERLKAKYGSVR